MLSFTSSGGGFLGRGPVLPRASLKNPAGGGGDKDGAAAAAGGKRGGGVGRAKCGYRFYVLKQGYLRNSRRIMEISPGTGSPPTVSFAISSVSFRPVVSSSSSSSPRNSIQCPNHDTASTFSSIRRQSVR
jgi:hypothetical protein